MQHEKNTQTYIFYKPYGVISQFQADCPSLSDYIKIKDIYPAGRLDKDSEGLMVLTSDGKLQNAISSPNAKVAKSYYVQVEKIINQEALLKLNHGVLLKDGMTKKAQVYNIDEPHTYPRSKPIRYRANIPTSWISVSICEGRNRQVRRMTAQVGFPTLRLIRYAIGPFRLDKLAPGEIKKIDNPWILLNNYKLFKK